MAFRGVAGRLGLSRVFVRGVCVSLWAAAAGLVAPAAIPSAAAQTFTVSNGSGSGAGSLPQAINSADTYAGAAVIKFTYAGVISLTGSLLDIANNVTMQNTSGGAVTIVGGGTPTFLAIDPGFTLSLAASGAGLTRSTGVFVNGEFDISATTTTAVQTLSGLGIGNVTLGAATLSILDGSTTFAGSIDGAGRVVIKGGVETFDGGNHYSGGTRLDAGTLVIGGPLALGTGLLAIAGGATLQVSNFLNLSIANKVKLTGGVATVDLANSLLTLSGPITGAGGLSATDGGLLILTGRGAYTGGTTIGAGAILEVGDGGTTGSIKGAVVDGDDLAFNRSNKFTFGGAISGSGSVEQDSAGELVLTGASSYSGGTTVFKGTLGVGNDAALGTGLVTMLPGTTLTFTVAGIDLPNAIFFENDDPTIDTGAHNATVAGVISGVGALKKTGSGALTLTADETFKGKTTVAAGTLIVDGSLTNTTSLTLDAGTTLGGSGTVGGFVAHSGVTIAPGAGTPFSTLNVAGDIHFLSGSTYVVNINAAGQNDAIAATGKATISGGTVNVAAATGVYAPVTRYTIITAQHGVAGTFDSLGITSSLAFLTPTLSYDAKDVFLTLTSNVTPTSPVTFPSVALTPNQAATAAAIQGQGIGAPLYDAVLGQTVAGARAAFDALSGEIHPSAVSGAFEDSRLPREAVLDRLASPFGAAGGGATGFAAMNAIVGPSVPANVFTAWGQAFGSYGHIGGDGNAATLERSLGGFILGVDGAFDNRYRLGVAAGYTQSTISVDARSSSGNVDSTFGGVYGGASFNALQLRAGALYTFNRYGTDRSVDFPGFADTASAGYGGDTLQAFGEAGWRMPMSGFAGPTSIEPFVGALAMHVDTASFAESGGASALNGASQGYDFGATTLGVRGEATVFSNVPLLARGLIGWRHVFGDTTPTSVLAFASAPSLPFSIAGAPVARDSMLIEAGFDWRVAPNATVGVFYSGELAVRDVDNAIKGKLEVSF